MFEGIKLFLKKKKRFRSISNKTEDLYLLMKLYRNAQVLFMVKDKKLEFVDYMEHFFCSIYETTTDKYTIYNGKIYFESMHHELIEALNNDEDLSETEKGDIQKGLSWTYCIICMLERNKHMYKHSKRTAEQNSDEEQEKE